MNSLCDFMRYAAEKISVSRSLEKSLLNKKEGNFPMFAFNSLFYVFIGFARNCCPTLSEKQSLSPSMRELMLLHHKIVGEESQEKRNKKKRHQRVSFNLFMFAYR